MYQNIYVNRPCPLIWFSQILAKYYYMKSVAHDICIIRCFTQKCIHDLTLLLCSVSHVFQFSYLTTFKLELIIAYFISNQNLACFIFKQFMIQFKREDCFVNETTRILVVGYGYCIQQVFPKC